MTADPIPVPTFSRLEYWNATTASWVIGHAGINLLYPHRYVERLAAKGKHGRVTLLDTGEVIGPFTQECPVCGELHPEPYDGSCLL